MSAIFDLKESLDKAIKEHASLQKENDNLRSDTLEATKKLNSLKTQVADLENKKSTFESEIRAGKEAVLREIEKRESESETMKTYLASEKKLVNGLKTSLEERERALGSEKAAAQNLGRTLQLKIDKLQKALEEAKA